MSIYRPNAAIAIAIGALPGLVLLGLEEMLGLVLLVFAIPVALCLHLLFVRMQRRL